MLLDRPGSSRGRGPGRGAGRSALDHLDHRDARDEDRGQPDSGREPGSRRAPLRAAHGLPRAVPKRRRRIVTGSVLAGLLARRRRVSGGCSAAPGGRRPAAGGRETAPRRTPKPRRAASTESLEALWTETVRATKAGDPGGRGEQPEGAPPAPHRAKHREPRDHRPGAGGPGHGPSRRRLPGGCRGGLRPRGGPRPGASRRTLRVVRGPAQGRARSGVVPSIQAMTAGVLAYLPTARGTVRATELRIVVGLIGGFPDHLGGRPWPFFSVTGACSGTTSRSGSDRPRARRRPSRCFSSSSCSP